MIRASMLGKLMASPDKSVLPAGAITELDKIISQKLLNWRNAETDFFTTEKGKQCENDSIELYNEFKDTFYVKNVERVTKDYLTGECDLLDEQNSLVVDIKTSYSKATHPLNLTASKLYEWQLRAYMYLYNVNHAELAYCLVNTPPDLIKKQDPENWHVVDDLPLNLRVRTFKIERDLEKENQFLNRIKLCEEYVLKGLELK